MRTNSQAETAAQQPSSSRKPSCSAAAATIVSTIDPARFQREVDTRLGGRRAELGGHKRSKDQQRANDLHGLIHDESPSSRRRQAGYGASSRPAIATKATDSKNVARVNARPAVAGG